MKNTNLGKVGDMSAFWADLTKIATKNERLNAKGDRSSNETIVGTTRNTTNYSQERDSHSRGAMRGMHGGREERKHMDNPNQDRSCNRRNNLVGTDMC